MGMLERHCVVTIGEEGATIALCSEDANVNVNGTALHGAPPPAAPTAARRRFQRGR